MLILWQPSEYPHKLFLQYVSGVLRVLYICRVKQKQTRTMKAQFEIGKTYEATGHYGNSIFTVISRTDKTVTVQTVSMGVKRLKIQNFINNTEAVCYGAWTGTPQYLAA